MAADGQIVRFKIGEAFPADDPLARWMTVCAMALNDLLLVNRWLFPRMREETPTAIHENFYLTRLGAAHLFELASFLRRSDRRLAVVRGFVAALEEEPCAAYRDLVEIGKGGESKFATQLRHARNQVFHYQGLLLGDAEERESLKQAMAGHAGDERERGIERGRIEDIPPPLTGFRASFADDIAVDMMLPGDTEEEYAEFVRNVSDHIIKVMLFMKPALNAYTWTRPQETWRIEHVPARGVDPVPGTSEA
jgi:hypothetical protein